MGKVITIDGPAASGKSSVSRELARRLGWNWVSTGAFYRGLGFVAHELGVDLNDENVLAELTHSDVWQVLMEPERTEVYFQGRCVTDDIGQEWVGGIASKISHFPKVREALLANQRDCADKTEGLVAEGRDCGTVVFPKAEVKVYLTANSEYRAERRAKELGLNVEETVAAQKVRDHQDSSRKTAPLQIPENALVLDTTHLSLAEVIEQLADFTQKRLN